VVHYMITVDTGVENDSDQTSNVLAHEVSHANDARTNPGRYATEKTTDANGKVIPHDSRPVEQRAIAGAKLSNDERKVRIPVHVNKHSGKL